MTEHQTGKTKQQHLCSVTEENNANIRMHKMWNTNVDILVDAQCCTYISMFFQVLMSSCLFPLVEWKPPRYPQVHVTINKISTNYYFILFDVCFTLYVSPSLTFSQQYTTGHLIWKVCLLVQQHWENRVWPFKDLTNISLFKLRTSWSWDVSPNRCEFPSFKGVSFTQL